MDDSEAIIFIQAHGNAMIAYKWGMKTHAHSDFVPNMQ